MGDIAISNELYNAYINKNIKPYKLKEANAEEFHNALKIAKQENPYGSFVSLHKVEDYKNMKLILTEDKKGGIAITKDNNIVSLFKGDSDLNNVAMTLIPVAIESGGKKLDNYNSSKLSTMYGQYGFIPIARVKFNKQYAENDWNYKRDGTPDILFWIHNGDSAAEVVNKFGDTGETYNLIKDFETYEDAELYRDKFIKKMENNDVSD